MRDTRAQCSALSYPGIKPGTPTLASPVLLLALPLSGGSLQGDSWVRHPGHCHRATSRHYHRVSRHQLGGCSRESGPVMSLWVGCDIPIELSGVPMGLGGQLGLCWCGQCCPFPSSSSFTDQCVGWSWASLDGLRVVSVSGSLLGAQMGSPSLVEEQLVSP